MLVDLNENLALISQADYKLKLYILFVRELSWFTDRSIGINDTFWILETTKFKFLLKTYMVSSKIENKIFNLLENFNKFVFGDAISNTSLLLFTKVEVKIKK